MVCWVVVLFMVMVNSVGVLLCYMVVVWVRLVSIVWFCLLVYGVSRLLWYSVLVVLSVVGMRIVLML